MSGEPARTISPIEAPQPRGARGPGARAAATAQGSQAAPARWFQRLPSESSGPPARNSAPAASAAVSLAPRRRAARRVPQAGQHQVRHEVERVERPGAQDQVQPGERVEDLGVGVGQHGLAEGGEGVPHRPGALGHGPHEALHLREPLRLQVAQVEGARAGERLAREEQRQQQQPGARQATRPHRRLRAPPGQGRAGSRGEDRQQQAPGHRRRAAGQLDHVAPGRHGHRAEGQVGPQQRRRAPVDARPPGRVPGLGHDHEAVLPQVGFQAEPVGGRAGQAHVAGRPATGPGRSLEQHDLAARLEVGRRQQIEGRVLAEHPCAQHRVGARQRVGDLEDADRLDEHAGLLGHQARVRPPGRGQQGQGVRHRAQPQQPQLGRAVRLDPQALDQVPVRRGLEAEDVEVEAAAQAQRAAVGGLRYW